MSDTTQLLRDLVALPSVNPVCRAPADQAGESRVTDYLERFFGDLGVGCQRVPAAAGRDNLVARLPGVGPTILFDAHQDTVSAEGMTVEPFAGRIENGRLYGRGACDVKAGMAAMLTAFVRVARERPAGAASLIFAATVDEEDGGLGVRALAESGLRADMAVAAEPTSLKIVTAHKGIVRWRLTTRGRACHSSRPDEGENAIYRMAGLLVAVEQFAEWLRTSPAHPLLGDPTLCVGRIEGGAGPNTVPDWCTIEIDRRLLPGEDVDAAVGQLTEYLKEMAGLDFPFEVAEPWLRMPPLAGEGSGELIRRLGSAIDAVCGSHQTTVVPYGTDASRWERAGVPAVVFGPGDIAQAHTADEWVDLAEVDRAAEILYRFVCDR